MTSDSAPRLYALVPCAGTGERAGQALPKQYAPLAGRSVVGHSLAALSAVKRLHAVLVVLSPDDQLFEQHVEAGPEWVARCGGVTRALTVARGLDELLARGARADDWVLVHDAARCLLRPEWIDALIDACVADQVGGLLALPLADTLKHESNGRVDATIDRRGKWQAQTPQMFRIGLLREALAAAGEAVTDEAGAVEALGHAPRLVPGALENFKLTYPADFELAGRLLAPRAEIKAFVPASDFEASRSFYRDLGFAEEWCTANLASLRLHGAAFLLQRFDVPAHANNIMMQLLVPDLDGLWQRLVDEHFAARHGVRASPPELRPWGLRDLELFDPSGVLWRFAQRPGPKP
jgi:2-C-methyl-D-erythritol 4-phosphate cytidylyltransferase